MLMPALINIDHHCLENSTIAVSATLGRAQWEGLQLQCCADRSQQKLNNHSTVHLLLPTASTQVRVSGGVDHSNCQTLLLYNGQS